MTDEKTDKKPTEAKPKRKGGLVKGLLVGAAVGAGTALLLAPRSGKETRKLIGRKTKQLNKQAKQMIASGKKNGVKSVQKIAKKAVATVKGR